ncbi:MAG: hypothetical protein V8T87_03535 [Victivallales bacterium]
MKRGNQNFAIVYDKSNRDRAFTSSVERAALLLEEAVEKMPPASNLPFWDCMNRIRQNSISIKSISVIMTSRKNSAPDPFKGPKQGYQLFTCPEGVVIAGYDSALLDQGKKILSPWSLAKFCAALYGAPAILPNASLAAAGIFPANTVRFSRRWQSWLLPAVRYSDYPRFYNRDGCWIGWSLRGKKKQWEALTGAYQKETDSPNRLTTMQEYWRLEPFMGPKVFSSGARSGAFPDHEVSPRPQEGHLLSLDESGYMRYNPKAHIGNDFDLTNLKFADIIIDAMKNIMLPGGKITISGPIPRISSI